MPHQGRIAEWNDERGFGFITPQDGSRRVFAHISEFPKQLRRPAALDLVTYDLDTDERGRPRASNISFLTPTAGRSGTVSARPLSAVTLATIGIFSATVLIAALAIGSYALWVPAAYLVLSGMSYVAYGLDKSAAQRGEYRAQESALHLLALFGGWPGALLAQQRFRHKTRKSSFQITFWTTVVLNCLMLAFLMGMLAQFPV